MEHCPFCWPVVQNKAATHNEHCALIRNHDKVLDGSYMIVTNRWRAKASAII